MKSYPKISQAYKKEATGIYDGHLIIEEKLDGSQFKISINTDGVITCASHNSKEGEPLSGMFTQGVKSAEHIFAGYKPEVDMVVYCEYFEKPRQNTVKYKRIPLNNLIVFDVLRGDKFLDRPQKELFCKQHGMEITPLLWEGDASEISTNDKINDAFKEELLKRTSILEHDETASYKKIEGFVVKNYNKLYDTKHFTEYANSTHPWMCIKIVSDDFKERNHEENPNRTNKFEELKENYRTEARMMKAIQHLKEDGLLTGQLSDLRLLVPEVIRDIEIEEIDGIKDALWRIFGKEITAYASKMMPEVYKKYLEDHKN